MWDGGWGIGDRVCLVPLVGWVAESREQGATDSKEHGAKSDQ
jgi:hypothetical protein